MISLDYDPARSAGVRDLLVTTATPVRSRRRRRIGLAAALVAGLSLLGASGAIAASYLLPGEDVVTRLEPSRTLTGSGAETIDLGPVPPGTNHIETELTCLSGGTLTWPDGASMVCNSGDVPNTSTYALEWSASRSAFALGATGDTSWRLTYTFSTRETTDLQTNAQGQTYGVDTPNSHPDLLAVQATNGRQGYISQKELDAVSCGDVRTPAEAVQCTRDHEGKTFTIPVYESDGTTRIGTFKIGG